LISPYKQLHYKGLSNLSASITRAEEHDMI
jgi:hypothetical protein